MNPLPLDQSLLPEYGTVSDYAQASHFTRQSLTNQCRKNKLHHRKIAGRIIIGKSDFLRWYESLTAKEQKENVNPATKTETAATAA